MPDSSLFSPRTRPFRLVLDTNVVMALWHFQDAGLAQLADVIRRGEVCLLTREDCLDELRRVLAYRQFGVDQARQLEVHASYVQACEVLAEPAEAELAELEALPRCRDGDDQKFLSLAWCGGADFLLTRDKLLLKLARRSPFRERFRIQTPERYQSEQVQPVE